MLLSKDIYKVIEQFMNVAVRKMRIEGIHN